MSSLKEMFYKLINEYADIYSQVYDTQNFKNDFGLLIRSDIPSELRKDLSSFDSTYSIKGSHGAGRWTGVPWIAVFDTRITTSAQKGVYIVYLLNKDKKELYLTLNQGATDVAQAGGNEEGKHTFTGIAANSGKGTTEKLKQRANDIADAIPLGKQFRKDSINSGSDAYDAGCIFSIKYTLESLPDDNQLHNDLKSFIDLYSEYYRIFHTEGENAGAESTEERHHDDDNKEMTNKEIIKRAKEYIEFKGFRYDGNLIENFYLSLKSKPFVILAGTSGTGKTRLVKLFAEAIGANIQTVPVRPDWSDSSDLFGHLDLTGRFVPGAIIDFVKEASENLDKPYFLCLDEMNLARVEYYLSDFLSIIETRDFNGSQILTDKLLSKEKYGADAEAISKYGDLGLPENLYVIGTVNMDETTFPFSKKVLDRANTIEFSYVDLMPEFTDISDVKAPVSVKNKFLKTEYLQLAACGEDADYIESICSELSDINEVLKKVNAHVGYRVRDEIVFYMLNNKKAQLLNEDEAMDNEIMQKILPRIQGSSSAVKDMLCDLFKMFWGDYQGYQTAGNNLSEQMEKALVSKNGKYLKSSQKIAFMVRRFEEDGFTTYWL